MDKFGLCLLAEIYSRFDPDFVEQIVEDRDSVAFATMFDLVNEIADKPRNPKKHSPIAYFQG